MDTTDVDLLRQACAAADISVSRDDPALEYSQRLEGDAELSLGSFRARGHGRVSVQLEETIAVARVRTGCHDREVDGFRGTGLVLVQPHQSYRSTLDLVSADTVDLGLSALRRTAQDVYGEEAGHVAFDRPRPAGRAVLEDHPRRRPPGAGRPRCRLGPAAARRPPPADGDGHPGSISARRRGPHPGDPATGDTLRGTALRWMFPDAGNFVRRYRSACGMDPAATLLATTAGDRFPRSGPFLLPQRTYTSWWEDLELISVSLDPGAMEDLARRLVGDDAFKLAFTGTRPVSPAMGSYWQRTVAHVGRDLLTNEHVVHSPLVRADIARSLTTVLLHTFPNTFLSRREAGPGPSPSAGATVEAMAARWGFPHRGRFAAAYRARHGRAPADTLRS